MLIVIWGVFYNWNLRFTNSLLSVPTEMRFFSSSSFDREVGGGGGNSFPATSCVLYIIAGVSLCKHLS